MMRHLRYVKRHDADVRL